MITLPVCRPTCEGSKVTLIKQLVPTANRALAGLRYCLDGEVPAGHDAADAQRGIPSIGESDSLGATASHQFLCPLQRGWNTSMLKQR